MRSTKHSEAPVSVTGAQPFAAAAAPPSPAHMWQEPKKEGSMNKNFTMIMTGVYVVLVLLGIGSGYMLSTKLKGSAAQKSGGMTQTETTAGVNDTATFKDTAVGVVEAGGIDGEGSHKLVRDNDPSHTACLVSSVLDLDKYVGKKVKVWSKTETPKNCGWLMDVGKIELQ